MAITNYIIIPESFGRQIPTVSPEYNGKNQCVLYVSMAIIGASLFALSFSFISQLTLPHHTTIIEAYAQPNVETVKYRNLTIDFGNGLKTNAQLTIPAVGE